MAEKETFRISVCLSRFFDDVRAQCYMSVQGRRRVVWLQRRLRRIFALPRAVCLLSRGHLLPPDELLALLRPDDPVEVMPLPAGCNWAWDKHTILTADSPQQLVVQQERKKQKKEKKKVVATETNVDDTSRAMDCDDGCESGGKSKCDIPNDVVLNTEQKAQEHNKLAQVKQNALLMLQLFEENGVLQSTESDLSKTVPEKRVRRRARRRPQTKPTVDIAVSQSESSPSLELQFNISGLPLCQSPSHSLPAASAPAPAPVAIAPIVAALAAAPAAVVVRNDAATPRAARIVHPLDESCDKSGALIALPAGS